VGWERLLLQAHPREHVTAKGISVTGELLARSGVKAIEASTVKLASK
jgi:hypothetical protein